jgi:hypothetical protein
MPNISDEEQEAIDFYSKCRSHNEHEDGLVNQRLTWLMTLQGLLFTAYGFSMSAEAISLGAKALEANPSESAKQALQSFAGNLTYVRRGLVVLGILSSLAALLGVLAAFRAIKDNERDLTTFTVKLKGKKKLFPMVIGGRSSNVMGMICGTVMPFLTAGGWIWVGNLQGTWLYVWIGILAVFFLSTLRYVFEKLLFRKASRLKSDAQQFDQGRPVGALASTQDLNHEDAKSDPTIL